MKRLKTLPALVAISAALGLWLGFAGAAPQSAKKTLTYNFDQDHAGTLPAKFHSALTGGGSAVRWEVLADPSAPSSPNVVAQLSTDTTDYRFPLLIADDASFRDVDIRVKFKAISGKVDRAAGVVFRLKDANNYYIVRANALENNYRLYHVVNGRRVQFAGSNFKVTSGEWHDLRVAVTGNKIVCYYDGQKKIEATDDTFKDAGKTGLWTKADSVTYFDDLTVDDLAAHASASTQAPTLAQKLVDELAKNHPDLVRIGLHVTPPSSPTNIIIASNVPAKVGQVSDPEDLQSMNTGQPVVLREGENLDVTLRLHDAAGKTIGAIGLTFKPARNGQQVGAVQRAKAIAAELEKRIPSKESLFTPVS
jgi:hypothetical protein